MASVQVKEQRWPPVRGLAAAADARGRTLRSVDVLRWLRINRHVFRAEKIDVLAPESLGYWPKLFERARELNVPLSLRTGADTPPSTLDALVREGLLDVFLAPGPGEGAHMAAWLEACRGASLPIRVQLLPESPAWPADPAAFCDGLAQSGVCAATAALFDPLQRPGPPTRDVARTLERMQAFANACIERGIEANLEGLPFCCVDEALWPHVRNRRQAALDHQHYIESAYLLAEALRHRGPMRTRIALAMLLSRFTLQRDAIDTKILPWILNRPWLYARLIAWHRLTRHARFLSPAPVPCEERLFILPKPAPRHPACAKCRMAAICDGPTPDFTRALPGVKARPIEGEPVLFPMHFARRQPKHYDAVDAARAESAEQEQALARTANDIITNRPPDRRIGPSEYGTDDTVFHQLEGAVQWYAQTRGVKVSRPLALLEPPCTVSVKIGGGLAEFAGFSFGRHCRIVCPMEATRHAIALHVDAQGRYVLLRDGLAVRPSQFEGGHYAPMRLPDRLELRLCLCNIDRQIFTQFVDVWQGAEAQPKRARPAKYSIVIVNTRYTRRLQAVLRCIAHQQDFNLDDLEVVVCYVPGLDATDDLIDSARLAYPDLHILRSPFPETRTNSKGFIINESLRMASGEWVVLMDADTLVPPNTFAKLDVAAAGAHFVALDGRLLLNRETTARILMGELDPWRDWDALLKGPGELRLRESLGVPVGFFQAVRRTCFEQVQYQELDHFEGADMKFGMEIIARFGKEVRLLGLPALHLDHEGSQWYGTQKHF